ncbi:NADPH-dependent F420 reductase [Lentzea sp. NPDC058450]|uniref:NADPH-dependent F420 reductase n=1 Tax=Lentzea sp. NPDC058450 TaxID=3346505 RepID=UPI003667332A
MLVGHRPMSRRSLPPCRCLGTLKSVFGFGDVQIDVETEMNQTLGVIGSGNIGGAVARLAVEAGIEVVLSNSRGPETLRGLVSRLGPLARAATPAEAAAAGDWTVVAVPFRAVPHLPVDALAGKVVIDTNNYYPPRDGAFASLLAGGLTDGELFGQYLPGARTVKTFNTIFFEHLLSLSRASTAPDRSALPVAGDDDLAKKSVSTLLDRLGFDAVDVGEMAESWRIQDGSPAYILPYLTIPNLRLPWWRDPGKQAGSSEIRAALESARRA